MKEFLIVFTQIFVTMDVFGILPIFMGMSQNIERAQRSKIVLEASITALSVAVAFVYLGSTIFNYMGITQDDFRIGGGILLFLIAIGDLISTNIDERRNPHTEIGIVPIGIPLIMGPAALTSIVIFSHLYSHLIVLLAVFLNVAIIWLAFNYSHFIIKVLGKGGTKAIGKIAALLLLAMSIMMIRVGIENMINNYQKKTQIGQNISLNIPHINNNR